MLRRSAPSLIFRALAAGRRRRNGHGGAAAAAAATVAVVAVGCCSGGGGGRDESPAGPRGAGSGVLGWSHRPGSFAEASGLSAYRRIPPCLCCASSSSPPPRDSSSRRAGRLIRKDARSVGHVSFLRGGEGDLDSAIHRIEGDALDVFLLKDGDIEVPLSRMFPTVGAAEWAEYAEIQPDSTARLSSGCALLRSKAGPGSTDGSPVPTNILLDTGLGVVDPPHWPVHDLRHLLLRAAGLEPADIDAVVHTHLHRDHTGWNVIQDLNGEVVPLFPNAKHYVQAKEWDFWSQSVEGRERTRFETHLEPLERLGMLSKVTGPHQIHPSVQLLPCEGHTPGHQMVRIVLKGADDSKKTKSAIWIGDAIHHVAQVSRPDWSPVFDWDPLEASKSRKKLMGALSEDDALLLSPHFPFPGIRKIARVNENKFTSSKQVDLQ